MEEIQSLAARYGLSLEDLAALLGETDEARGMVAPAEVGAAMEELARLYIQTLKSAAERFEDPAERLVADRLVSIAGELLVEQMSSVASPRN